MARHRTWHWRRAWGRRAAGRGPGRGESAWQARLERLAGYLNARQAKEMVMKAVENSLARVPRYPFALTGMFNAPRERVFAAWTQAENLAQWWGPEGFTVSVCEVDARPGGAIRIHMRGPDATEYSMTGVYVEVVPLRRIVFVSSPLDGDGKPLFKMLTTVTFTERENKTRLTLRTRVSRATPAAAPYLAGMEEGWRQTLARLDALLKQPLRA